MDIKNKNCLVVGGGNVGMRKAATLEKCQANVTVVSRIFFHEHESLKTTSIIFKNVEGLALEIKDMFVSCKLKAQIKKYFNG